MKNGDSVAITIDRLGPDGVGQTTIGERTLKIPGTVPGDRADVRIRKIKRYEAQGEVVTITEPGIPRISPPCPHFRMCGGCRWQDIPYDAQCAMKAGIVASGLSSGVPGYDGPLDLTVTPSPDVYGYRNKMEFSFDRPPGGDLSLGLHELGRYDRVFDVTGCLLQSARSNLILDEVRQYAREHDLPVWGLKSHRGLLRYLAIREGAETGEAMVNIVTTSDEFPGVSELCDRLMTGIPGITTIVRSINDRVAGVAFGDSREVLRGEGVIHDRIGGLTFKISPDSFFQTNTRQAAILYAAIAEFIDPDGSEHVLDLYCGTGTIGITLAGRVSRVTGIELIEDAVRDARLNASANGVSNCTFITGKVEKTLDESMNGCDVVICDPPRVGIHPRAMDWLVRARIPRIVYVSCNSRALPGDLAVLMMAGYKVRDIRLFDMSPHTPHIETVVSLALR
jgi:23S rRNA (uracil1939-C5)-methyltransferase